MNLEDYLFQSDDIQLHGDFVENMRACLYATEKHAVAFGQLIEDRGSLIDAARHYLPKYTIVHEINADRVNADCVMIKQSVIDMFGLPDQSGGSLQDAFSDYCKRINRFGFSTLVAHHALYSNVGADTIRPPNATTPNNPTLHFLTLLDDEYYPKKRILFDCIIMPPSHGGTTEVMLSSFEAFYRLFKDKYDIYMYTNREAAEYHSIADKYENILYPDTIEGEVFHIGFAPNPLIYYEPQLQMNRHCLKIVQLVLDMQMMRISGHFAVDVRNNVNIGVDLSDGIMFISNYSKNDFMAYYADECSFENKKLKVIYIAKKLTEVSSDGYEVPFDDYFLIPGSPYGHKAVSEAIGVVSETKYNYIAIGAEDTGYIYPNVYGYMGSRLDEGLVNLLYARCKAVIFPSLYEGFGLPTVMGLMNGKRVILCDNEINRELLGLFPEFNEHFLFFRRFEQIGDILMQMGSCPAFAPQSYEDSWDRVAAELESFFAEMLGDDVDTDMLKRRWKTYKQIEARAADVSQTIKEQNACINEMRQIIDQFDDYKLSSLLRFAAKENIKHKRPWLFAKLKGLRKPE